MGEPTIREQYLRGLPIQRTDKVNLRCWNSSASVEIQLRWLIETPTGEIIQGDANLKPTSDLALSETSADLRAGMLVSCNAQIISGAAIRGECFVQVNVIRGSTNWADNMLCLIQDYITVFMATQWPNNQLRSPQEGSGYTALTTLSNAGAGNEIFFAGITNIKRRIDSVAFRYQASANVANRYIRLEWLASTGEQPMALMPMPQVIVASEWWTLSWFRGAPYVVDTVNKYACMPLPEIYQYPNQMLQSKTIGMDGSDSIVYVRQADTRWFYAS